MSSVLWLCHTGKGLDFYTCYLYRSHGLYQDVAAWAASDLPKGSFHSIRVFSVNKIKSKIIIVSKLHNINSFVPHWCLLDEIYCLNDKLFLKGTRHSSITSFWKGWKNYWNFLSKISALTEACIMGSFDFPSICLICSGIASGFGICGDSYIIQIWEEELVRFLTSSQLY